MNIFKELFPILIFKLIYYYILNKKLTYTRYNNLKMIIIILILNKTLNNYINFKQ